MFEMGEWDRCAGPTNKQNWFSQVFCNNFDKKGFNKYLCLKWLQLHPAEQYV